MVLTPITNNKNENAVTNRGHGIRINRKELECKRRKKQTRKKNHPMEKFRTNTFSRAYHDSLIRSLHQPWPRTDPTQTEKNPMDQHQNLSKRRALLSTNHRLPLFLIPKILPLVLPPTSPRLRHRKLRRAGAFLPVHLSHLIPQDEFPTSDF